MGWSSVCITGNQSQTQRLEGLKAIRECRVRVLISTDLTARGIDIEQISLVVNLDLPRNPATYLHRVGRTGRFGTHGIAVSLIKYSEVETMNELADLFQMSIVQYDFDRDGNGSNEPELEHVQLKMNTATDKTHDSDCDYTLTPLYEQWLREERMFLQWS